MGDLFGDDDPQIQQIIDMESVRAHRESYPGEQQMLLMRFHGNMTQAQISGQPGMSQMHAARCRPLSAASPPGWLLPRWMLDSFS